MAVLVAGIGYIGAQLVADLLASGEEVVAVDNFFSTDAAAVGRLAAHPRCHFVPGNFGDPRVLTRAFGQCPVSVVYCLAAQASAHPKAAPARYTETTNLLAPRTLLDAMLRWAVPAIVYGSSLRVYGDGFTTATTEEAPYGLLHDLSHLSKVYAEKLLEMYASAHGLRCISARLALVYGRGPVMKSDYRFMTAPNKFCRQIVHGEPIALHVGSDAITAFVHVADASTALRLLATRNAFAGYVPIDVATEWTSIANVAALAAEIARARGIQAPSYPPPISTVTRVGARLAETGFTPRQTLRGGLPGVIAYESTLAANATPSGPTT